MWNTQSRVGYTHCTGCGILSPGWGILIVQGVEYSVQGEVYSLYRVWNTQSRGGILIVQDVEYSVQGEVYSLYRVWNTHCTALEYSQCRVWNTHSAGYRILTESSGQGTAAPGPGREVGGCGRARRRWSSRLWCETRQRTGPERRSWKETHVQFLQLMFEEYVAWNYLQHEQIGLSA